MMNRWNKRISFSPRQYLGLMALATALLFTSSASSLEGQRSPQVLALVSIDKPMELLCFNGDCFVELSAFCLQADYKTPNRGTRYQVAGFGGIRVTGYTREGASVALDPSEHFQLSALRTHVAVRMSIRSEALQKMDLARVEVTVAPNVSLVAMPSDKYEPQSEVSVAVATGPWRLIGDRIVDRNQEKMSAARVTNRIANSLPPFTNVSRDTTRAIWADMENNGLLENMQPKAVQLLSDAYSECEGKHNLGGMTTMRECVSQMHDRFLNDLNSKYWDVIRGAS